MVGICEIDWTVDQTARVDVTDVRDLWVDGVLRVEIMGDVTRTFYWKWLFSGGIWRRAAAERSLLRPLHAFVVSPKLWAGVPIVDRDRNLH